MNRVLLDTHTLIWYRSGDNSLSKTAKKIIEDSELFISYASIWEISLLVEKGRILLNEGVTSFIENLLADNFTLLQFKPADFQTLLELPKIHKDPFDRILIAQAINHKLNMVTKDGLIKKYSIQTLW